MVDYSEYSGQNDLYASFVTSDAWIISVNKIRTKKVKEAIETHGIADAITPDGSYDFESGEMLRGTGLDPDEISDAAYNAICEVAEAYANFVKKHYKNPRNAGAKPLGDEVRVRTNVMLDAGLKAEAADKAAELGLSLSQLVNDLLSAYLSP